MSKAKDGTVYDRAEAERLLVAWAKHRPGEFMVAVEMAARHRAGVLGPLAELIDERVRELLNEALGRRSP